MMRAMADKSPEGCQKAMSSNGRLEALGVHR